MMPAAHEIRSGDASGAASAAGAASAKIAYRQEQKEIRSFKKNMLPTLIEYCISRIVD